MMSAAWDRLGPELQNVSDNKSASNSVDPSIPLKAPFLSQLISSPTQKSKCQRIPLAFIQMNRR